MFVQFSQSPPHICCVVVVVSHYEALIDSSVSFFSTVAGVFWFHPLYRFDGNVWLPESNSHVAGYAQIIPRQRWNMLKYARRRIVLNLHVAWARMPRVRSDTYCNGVLVLAFSLSPLFCYPQTEWRWWCGRHNQGTDPLGPLGPQIQSIRVVQYVATLFKIVWHCSSDFNRLCGNVW